MKKKILIISTLLLILTLSFSLVFVNKQIFNVYESGTGEKDTPYIIASEKQLKAFRNKVNNGNNYEDTYFELSNDIELNSSNWVSIGINEKNSFKGNFDGKNYSIKGLEILSEYSSNAYYGLFGYIEDARISNLIIKDANIKVIEKDKVYIGTLVAFSKNSVLENCMANSDIEALSEVNVVAGGLAGFSNGEILRSLSNANIKCNEDNDQMKELVFTAGVLVGENFGKIDTSAAGSSSIRLDNVRSKKTFVGSLIGFGEKKYITKSYYSENSDIRGTNSIEAGEEAVKLNVYGDEYYASFSYETNSYNLKFAISDEVLKTAKVSGFEYVPSTTCAVEVPSYVDVPNDLEGITYTTYMVTEVGEKAFSTSKVHNVDLPETITKIGNMAFQNASQIVTFKFPSKLSLIGEYAFDCCTALTKIELPDSLLTISKGAFANCTSVTTLKLPDKLKEIGDSAFESLPISTITFPENLEIVGAKAFAKSLLVVVNFGSKLKEIADEAFLNNELLKYVYFSGKAPKCGERVFYLEGEKENVKIYYNEKASGWDYDCVGLSNKGKWTSNINEVYWTVSISTNNILEFVATLSNEFETYDQQGVKYKVNRSAGTAIIVGSKEECNENIVIPDVVIYDTTILKVTKINASSFVNRNIKKVTVGLNVQSIARKAFVNCNSLESVYIMSQEAISIYDNSIYYDVAKNIEIVYTELPYGMVANIGITNYHTNHILTNGYDAQGILYTIVNDGEREYAVVGSDYKLDDERANTSYYNGSDYYSGVPGKAVIPDYVSIGDKYYRVASIGRYAFYNSQSLKDIELGAFIGYYQTNDPKEEANLPGVWDCSFRECLYLNNFSIDSRNTKYFIKNNGQLLCYIKNPGIAGESVQIVKASIDIEKLDASQINLTAIAPYAFANCSHLTEIELIGDEDINVVNVGKHAFENTALTSIDLKKMQNIGDEAFANCFDVKDVIIGVDTVLGYHVFKNCYSIEKFHSYNSNYLIDSHNALYKLKEENGYQYAVLMQYPASNYKIDKTFTESYNVNFIDLDNNSRLPVYLIDEYAFAYARLKNVIIGNNVLSIGKAAFMNCGALKRIEISQNLVYIGMEIDHDITIESLETELSNGERIKLSYEQEVFDNCYVLSQIVVDEENRFYYSDDNGVLYNKDKSTLLVYGQGISRLTYTIPQTVEYIALEAFQKNTHLQRVTIPEGVKEIGAKAFNGCTNLTWIYFRTIEAPKLNDQVFNSCGVNTDKEYEFVNSDGETVNTKFAIYCIPDPGVWYERYDYLWDNYYVEKYNSIQEVENDYVENADIYTLLINDSDGNSISDLNITIESLGRPRTIKSNELGFAIFTVPAEESLINGNAVKLTILDPNGIYYDYVVDEFVLDFSTYFSHITLTSKPVVDGLFYNDIDIKNGYLTSNIIAHAELDEENNCEVKVDANGNIIYSENIVITMQVQWDNNLTELHSLDLYFGETLIYSHSFSLNELNNYIENNVVLIESEFINSTIVNKDETNKNGIGLVKFTFNPSYFERFDLTTKNELSSKINIMMNNSLIEQEEKTYINVSLVKQIYKYEDILPEALDLSCDHEILNDTPLLKALVNASGGNISFGKALKLQIQYKKDKVTVGLNVSKKIWDSTKTNKDDYNYKFKSLKQLIKARDLNEAFEAPVVGEDTLQKTLTWSISGCLEITIPFDGCDCYISDVYLKGELKFKKEISNTIIVAGWPVTLGVEISASGKLQYSIVKFDDATDNYDYFKNPLKFEIKFGVEAYAGLGCSLVSISIYGEIGMKIALEMQLIEEKYLHLDEWALEFDLGLMLKIKMGLFNVKHKVSLYKLIGLPSSFIICEYDEELGKQVWFPQFKDGKTVKFKKFEDALNYYIREASTSFREWEYEDDYSQYDGMEPEYINYNGDLYRFYIDNVYANPIFDSLVGYDKYNYLKLVYQIQNEDGTWSDPQLVNDSLYNDCEFEVEEVNGELVVVYTALNEALTQETLETYAQYTEVYTSIISSSGLSEASRIYTNDESTSFDIDVTEYNGDTYISWIDNLDMNPVGLSNETEEDVDGNVTFNVTDKNVINICNLEGESTKIENLAYIPYTEFIEIDSTKYLAYIVDVDCDTATVNDRQIYLVDLDNFESVQILEEGTYEGITYANNTTYVYKDNNLSAITFADGKFEVDVIAENITNNHQIIFDESGELYALASIDTYASNDENDIEYSNISVKMYDKNLKEFGKNVQITHIEENRNYIEYFTTYWDEDAKLHFAYTYSILKFEGEENEYYEYHENDVIIEKEFDLSLNAVDINKTEIIDGEEISIFVHVSNNSLESVSSLTFDLLYGGISIGSSTLEETLLSGESKALEFKVKFVNKGAEQYTVKVSSSNHEELNISNNELQLNLVFPDLYVNAKFVEIANIPYLLVLVKNEGLVASGKSYIYVNSGTYSMDENANTEDALYSLEIPSLAVGEYKYYTIELNKVYFVDNSATVYVDTESDEVSTINNYCAVSMLPNEKVDKSLYRLNYYIDGELKETFEYEKGTIIEALDLPSQEGYSFTGWVGMVDSMPAHDVNVYGFFEINKYDINYNVKVRDGFELQYTDSYEYNSVINERELVREGYTFSGWYLDEEFTNKANLSSNMPANNIDVYGKYEINQYNAYYYVNDELYVTLTMPYNSPIGEEEYSVVDGYSFSGWINVPETMPAYDINIYGYKTINTYTVSYYVDGELYIQNKVQYNTELLHPSYTPREGYTFSGFEYESELMPAHDINIYATNSVNVYTLNYYIDDELVHSVEYEYGQDITTYEYVNNSIGYTHSGWDNEPTIMPANDVNVYSQLVANTYYVIYMVDGEEVYRDPFVYNSTITLRESITQEGYTFSGWDNPLDATLMPNQDIIVNGTFEINTYKLNYYINGEKVYSEDLEYNSAITEYEYVTPIGYDFSGWYDVPETMPANDLNIYGVSTIQSFSIKYYVDNELVKEISYPYNALITAYNYVSDEGYNFSGWNNLPETMPANDLDIYGLTSLKEYNINYYVNGKLVETAKCEYSKEIEVYDYVPEEGVTFLGFEDVPKTMPARDLNVYGFEALNTYTITYFIDNVEVAKDIYTYNQDVHEKAVEEIVGYTFSGWDKKVSKMPAENLEIHGTYNVNQYKIKYYVDEFLVYTDLVDYKASINLRADESKKGYTFSGWGTCPSEMPAHDITLFASFAKNVYKVQYYIGAELYKIEEYYYNDNINLPKEIFKDGYQFNNWLLDGQAVTELKMGAQDIILYANMTEVKNQNMPLIIIGASVGGGLVLSTAIFCIFKFKKGKK